MTTLPPVSGRESAPPPAPAVHASSRECSQRIYTETPTDVSIAGPVAQFILRLLRHGCGGLRAVQVPEHRLPSPPSHLANSAAELVSSSPSHRCSTPPSALLVPLRACQVAAGWSTRPRGPTEE